MRILCFLFLASVTVFGCQTEPEPEPADRPNVVLIVGDDFGFPYHSFMKFGVKPSFELSDLSDTTLLKLVHTVTDEEIDQEIDNLLKKEADLQTREEGGIEETDHEVGVAVAVPRHLQCSLQVRYPSSQR